MLPRTDYSVVVPVSVELAFRAFSDLERLLHREIYEEVSWIEGSSWQVGSRIRYVVTKPVRATISAVVTSYEPPRYVALLNHGMGVTAEQQVIFTGSLHGDTRVRMVMDFVGKSPDLPEDVIQQAITLYTHDALDTMAALCNKWKAASSSG
jgi:polyketide cyclase/dehydrase/lipid transport protein